MFDLHRLGWHEFQRLCSTVAREVLGQTHLSFLSSRDGGRDGAFFGTWLPEAGQPLDGSFVIQCKHFSKASQNLQLSDLSAELPKAARLHANGRCDIYVVMTNASLSGKTEEVIVGEFRRIGVKHVFVFGCEWICEQIRERKRLRMLVPRLYGLGDLSQIIDERAYQQAEALLASLQEDLAKFVITDAYHRSAVALEDHGFVLLTGEPAAGKTTIAASLAMAAIDQWSCSIVSVTEPAEIVAHWNPDEPKQFFWIDDAFGVMQYEANLVFAWNRVFPQVSAAIRAGARIVMTSRDYIYNAARSDLKVTAFPLLQESRVVIDVRDLRLSEKERILYNHLKLGSQPMGFRGRIKPFLQDVAKHERFVPEIARRLSRPIFTEHLTISREGVMSFVERREHLVREVISGLDKDCRAALALIYMSGGELGSPIVLEPRGQDALSRLDSSLGR